jgi:hypothetical protein
VAYLAARHTGNTVRLVGCQCFWCVWLDTSSSSSSLHQPSHSINASTPRFTEQKEEGAQCVAGYLTCMAAQE